MSSTLVFVYNADSGIFNALSDMVHKLVSPGTYPYGLCALTYGTFGMHKEWRDFVSRLGAYVKFLHADELGRYGVAAVPLPAVFLEQAGGLEVLIYKDALDACQNLADLKSLVADSVKRERVSRQQT